MQRLPEIIQGYFADDIWNMGESGLFLKALPDTLLAKKTKKCKGGKKIKRATYCGIVCVLEWIQGM